ncbi:hypothetical protein [Bradyrhizobium sp. 1(2017)]|uniref:hypothetical protein n=1 Tax=Bradyrhizobium sp. 1(2017) TaxID=1404888 RepID=UPI00140EFCE9|nr:hypothetical protein [Bradyrhizobium sp. 1(2017)]QIO35425.1 hypothetical protein HAP40_28270 [Bradyrhizobium sp. 1(2017)]
MESLEALRIEALGNRVTTTERAAKQSGFRNAAASGCSNAAKPQVFVDDNEESKLRAVSGRLKKLVISTG